MKRESVETWKCMLRDRGILREEELLDDHLAKKCKCDSIHHCVEMLKEMEMSISKQYWKLTTLDKIVDLVVANDDHL